MQPPYNAAFYFVLCSKDRLSDPLMPYAWGWEVLGDDEGEARNSLLSPLPAKTRGNAIPGLHTSMAGGSLHLA